MEDIEGCFSVSDQFQNVHTTESPLLSSRDSQNSAEILAYRSEFLAGMQTNYLNTISSTNQASPGSTPIQLQHRNSTLLNELPPTSFLQMKTEVNAENTRNVNETSNENYLLDSVKEKRLEDLTSPIIFKKSFSEESKLDASSERTMNNQFSLDDDFSFDLEKSDLDPLDFNPSDCDHAIISVDSENDSITSNFRISDSEPSITQKSSIVGNNTDKFNVLTSSWSTSINKNNVSNIPIPTPKK
ncbi:hypothetical protein HK096_004778, partial [Nowakowskiella sp. JEL0078]